jgi:hypothetical protein
MATIESFSQAVQTSNSSSITVDLPSGTQEGDKLIAIANTGRSSASGWSAPSGFTPLFDEYNRDINASTSSNVRAWVKTAGTSEPDDYTFSLSSGDGRLVAQLFRVSGLGDVDVVGDWGGSIFIPPNERVAGQSHHVSAPSVTTTSSDGTLISFWVCTHPIADDITLSQPTGMSLGGAAGTQTDFSSIANTRCSNAMAIGSLGSAGATGDQEWELGPDFFEIYDGTGTPEFDAILVAFEADAPSGPAIQSGTIANPTTEGFQLRFTTDTANGTAYYVLYPTTEDDPTDPEDIKNAADIGGVAPIRDGSVAVTTTGEQTFPAITGLDPNTTYRAAVVHYGAPD